MCERCATFVAHRWKSGTGFRCCSEKLFDWSSEVSSKTKAACTELADAGAERDEAGADRRAPSPEMMKPWTESQAACAGVGEALDAWQQLNGRADAPPADRQKQCAERDDASSQTEKPESARKIVDVKRAEASAESTKS